MPLTLKIEEQDDPNIALSLKLENGRVRLKARYDINLPAENIITMYSDGTFYRHRLKSGVLKKFFQNDESRRIVEKTFPC